MKILILGKGFIGTILQKELKCNICSYFINTLNQAEDIINIYKPKILINCIGVTGKNNVDDCEIDKDRTLLANTFIPIILAEICLRRNIKLIHISSGCIFNYNYNKDKPITETKVPNFFGLYYSRTKIYAERSLEILSKQYNILIVRIRIPLLNYPHHRDILTKLIKYGKVIDIPNSVTYIPDFVKAIKHLIKINARGIYNVVNKGGLRYPKLMDAAGCKYKIIDFKKLGLVRTNLLLSTRKLEQSGFKVRNINSIINE